MLTEELIKNFLDSQINESAKDGEFYNVKLVVEKVSSKSSRELFSTVLEIKDNKRIAIERYSTLVRQFYRNNDRKRMPTTKR